MKRKKFVKETCSSVFSQAQPAYVYMFENFWGVTKFAWYNSTKFCIFLDVYIQKNKCDVA